MNNLVSVIIPIHNRFEVVDQAIATIVAQTYRPLEIIIVDDASDIRYVSDISIKSISDITLKQIRFNNNIGPGNAREAGRRLSQGDYICYLDSDDLLDPSKIEKQVKALLQNPEAGMCYCQTTEFSKLPISGNEPLRNRNDQSYREIFPTIFRGRPWSTSACMWTRYATDLIGPWFGSSTWEDYEYDCRAGCSGIKIQFLPEVLCYKRNDTNIPQLSSRTSSDTIRYQAYSIIEMTKNLISSKKIHDEELQGIYIYKVLKPCIKNLVDIGDMELALRICKDILSITKPFSKNWVVALLLDTAISIGNKLHTDFLISYSIKQFITNRR